MVSNWRPYVLEVTVVDELNQHEHIDKHLAFGQLCDLGSARHRAVQLGLHVLIGTQGSWLGREAHTREQVRQVVLENQKRVAQGVQLAQLFELLG